MTDTDFHLESTYSRLPEVFFSKLSPTPVSDPEIVIFNEKLACEIGWDLSDMSEDSRVALLAGNLIPDGTEPLAQAYAGHQFGHFTMLGDGRAILLGEHLAPSGQRLDIQFKGSGRTPYSRGGDGRAALGPMLREYVISEAMHALKIPTTRSLAVVTTGEKVYRETELPGAILTRIASSHIRVGTFQYAALHEDKAIVKALVDYLIDRHFPLIKEKEDQPLALLEAIIEQQADLITHWMRVGFIHGVMNTDNMALSGETIDYGPCAFMDTFGPDTVFSSIDHGGRYAYANQPNLAQWNLARLAECLLPLLDEKIDKAKAMAEDVLRSFDALFQGKWFTMMRSKLGLHKENTDNNDLATDLLDWMHESEADFTNTFLDLMKEQTPPKGAAYNDEKFKQWHARWESQLEKEDQPFESCLALMQNSNPTVIPRNHKVEEALQAADEDDLQPFHKLLSALDKPYENGDQLKPYQSPPKPDEKVQQTFCGT